MMMNPQRQDEAPTPLQATPANPNQNLVIGENESHNPHFAEHATTSRHEQEAPPSLQKKKKKQEAPPHREEYRDVRPCASCRPHFCFPFNEPVRQSRTIERLPPNLRSIVASNSRNTFAPTAVAIGPYYRGSSQLSLMEEAKSAAVVEFCRVAGQSREAVHGEILSVAGEARRCYGGDYLVLHMDDNKFVDMMLKDGCFLVQFMVSMMRSGVTSPELDPLMSRAEVHRSIDAIAQDILLLENQIPWVVLERLRQLRPVVPVDGFLALMASAFEIGNINNGDSTSRDQNAQEGEENGGHDQPPPHLLGLFHRRQMGAARTQSLRVPILSSLYSTAVELAEMGVKLTASKTNKFGDMAMTKRRRRLGLFGELSLAPVVLNHLTVCWLFNMAAYEACLDVTRADNFAVSSYITLASILMNRREDVQEMRAKGLVVSAFSDEVTLGFFKWLAPHLQVGHRYYDVFERLQEYRKERWLWIAVHRFLYKNIKTIIAVLSVIGVVAGLFKTILSLKQPQQ